MEARRNNSTFDVVEQPFKIPEKVDVLFSSEDMIQRHYNYTHQLAIHDEKINHMCSREELREAVNKQIMWTVGAIVASTALLVSMYDGGSKENSPQVVVVQQPVPVGSFDYWENDRK